MPIPAELKPLPESRFDADCARHLLNRAGFGGTPQQVQALAGLGLAKAVDRLVKYEPLTYQDAGADEFDKDIIRPPTEEERRAQYQARRANDEATLQKFERERNRRQSDDREQFREVQKWWLKRMIESPRPLEEKMTLFWHGHFATGYRTIEDSWHMYQQNQMFRRFATGNFAQLVRAVVRDPAMIKYLDNDENRKGKPNENLARELMELFTLGEGRGYTENDIKEGARALTGLTFKDDEGVFLIDQHDGGHKTILGFGGAIDADRFVDLILARKECPEFICTKLYRFLVNDAPGELAPDQKAFVKGMSRLLVESKAELKPVLRAVFMSEHFHHPANRAAIIKSPVQLIVQAVRQFHTPVRELSVLNSAADLMGQNLLQPPNVKGWDGGRSWINTSTLFTRQNLLVYLLTGRSPRMQEWESSEQGFDARHLVDGARKPDGSVPSAEGVTWLLRCSLATTALPERVRAISQCMDTRKPSLDSNEGVIEALCLITALPEYQLC
jgi:uncharacterized protein (DUF1800 family)